MACPYLEPAHHSTIDLVHTFLEIAAILIAGFWSYISYLRGRTFKLRMEPSIVGKSVEVGGVQFISGIARVKNVGLSKLPIEQTGTAILVSDLLSPAPTLEPTCVNEGFTLVLEVFKKHTWVEPGEPIEELFMLRLPENPERVALKLQLRLVVRGIEWNADSIIDLSSTSK